MNSFYSPARSRKNDITVQEYETAKRYLVSKIMNGRIVWFEFRLYGKFPNFATWFDNFIILSFYFMPTKRLQGKKNILLNQSEVVFKFKGTCILLKTSQCPPAMRRFCNFWKRTHMLRNFLTLPRSNRNFCVTIAFCKSSSWFSAWLLRRPPPYGHKG